MQSSRSEPVADRGYGEQTHDMRTDSLARYAEIDRARAPFADRGRAVRCGGTIEHDDDDEKASYRASYAAPAMSYLTSNARVHFMLRAATALQSCYWIL